MMSLTRGQGFGPEVKRRVMLSTYALSAGYYEAYYGQAQKVRTLIIQDYQRMFEDFDLLVSPTSPTTAFPFGAKVDDPLAMYLNDVFTMQRTSRASPRSPVPCGLDEQGLPVGLRLTAPVLGEPLLLRAANAGRDLGLVLRPLLWPPEPASSRATPPRRDREGDGREDDAPAASERPRIGSSARYPRYTASIGVTRTCSRRRAGARVPQEPQVRRERDVHEPNTLR